MPTFSFFGNFRPQRSYGAQILPIFISRRRGPDFAIRFPPFPLKSRFRKKTDANQSQSSNVILEVTSNHVNEHSFWCVLDYRASGWYYGVVDSKTEVIDKYATSKFKRKIRLEKGNKNE